MRSLQVRLTRKRRVNNEQHPNHSTTIQHPTGCDSTQSVAISTEKRNSLTRTTAQEQPQLVHKSSQKRTPIPSRPLKARNSISAPQTTPEAEESFFSPSGPEGHHSYYRTFSDIMRTPSAGEKSFTSTSKHSLKSYRFRS